MILASNLNLRLDTQFEGFCFDGSDYIAEFPGFAWHRQATGQAVRPGLDGCYAVAQWTDAGYEIGTDNRGMSKLFVYESGSTWAVASSLQGLAEFLGSHGVTLTPRRILFDAMHLPGTFVQQQMSRSSIFEEITLVPSFDKLLVIDGDLRRRPVDLPTPDMSYGEALRSYVEVWRSRSMTLLGDERIQIGADLSGGLDSRVGFAFLVASGRFSTADPRFRLISNESNAQDFDVATRVAAAQGLTLNGPSLERRRVGSSARLAINRWRTLCLGVYTPVYFHPQVFDPFVQNSHGAGGEAFRFQYSAVDLRDRMRPYQAHLERPKYRELVNLLSGEAEREAARRPHLHPLTVQFREHRNRFHFGYAPHNRASFTPLNSASLDAVTDRAGLDPVSVYHDIYDALVPGLKDLPFDDPAKGPKSADVSEAALGAREVDPRPGRAYVVEDAVPPDEHGGNTYRLWLAEVRAALQNPQLGDLIDHSRIRQMKVDAKAIGESLPKRPRPNSPELMGLSAAVAADFAIRRS